MCRTTQTSDGGMDSKAEIGAQRPPYTISIKGGLNLLELLFPFVSTVIYKPNGIFWFQGGLIGKFAIIWSGFQCSVAVKTGDGQSQLPSSHFHLRGERWAVWRHVLATLKVDRVPVPVIPIQGRTLLQCKKCGSIRKFEAPYL